MTLFWIFCLQLLVILVKCDYTPQEVAINAGRPAIFDCAVSFPGKIVLEEHVTSNLFRDAFTTPVFNNTNELPYDEAIYLADVGPRLLATDIVERVHQMDLANISVSVVTRGYPGIQGFFNTSLATEMAKGVNDQLPANYSRGNYSDRFEFFCQVALQDPVSAATEAERCVKELGGVGVMVGGYTNNGSVNEVIYLDHAINEPFWDKMAELDVPFYLHPRIPPPNQQRVYQGYDFLAGSPWGFATETAAHALRLMVSRLFDRHPTLQVILGHCGESLPFSLARVDQRMRHFQKSLWPARQTMTYYYKTNFWVTTSGVQDDGALFDTLRVTGADRVMFSADYPYEDFLEIGSWFDRVELDDATKEKVASGNAKKLLKLGI